MRMFGEAHIGCHLDIYACMKGELIEACAMWHEEACACWRNDRAPE